MVIGEKMDINSLRAQVRRVLVEIGPPSEVQENNPETDAPGGLSPVSLAGAEYAKKFGYETFSLMPSKASEIFKRIKRDIEGSGVTFTPNNETVMSEVFETLDAETSDPTSKMDDEVKNSLDYAVITLLNSCTRGNDGTGFIPSDDGTPMMNSEDVPVKGQDGIKKFVAASAQKGPLNSEADLERMFRYVIDGLNNAPLIGSEYTTSGGEVRVIPREMLQGAVEKVKQDYGIQEINLTAGVENARLIASNLQAAGYATYEGSSATKYQSFLEAVVNCYDMTPVIALGPFSGINKVNQSIASEWQVATLIRLAAKREEAEYEDAVSSAVWFTVGTAATGALTGFGGPWLKEKFADWRLKKIKDALAAGTTISSQQIDELLSTQRVKDALKVAGEELSAKVKLIQETLARLEAERAKLFAEITGVESAKSRLPKKMRELASLTTKQNQLDRRLKALTDAVTARASGAPLPAAPPAGGPGGPPIIGGPPAGGGGGSTTGSTAAALGKELSEIRAARKALEQEIEAYVTTSTSLTDPEINAKKARLDAIKQSYDTSFDQLDENIKWAQETEIERFKRLMTEQDAKIIAAALNDKPPYNRLGLIGTTAAISIALGGGSLSAYYSALESAMDELSLDQKGAFILLAMTQDEYKESEFYVNSSSSNYFNEMTGGNIDLSGIQGYIRETYSATHGGTRRLNNTETGIYLGLINGMVQACLSDILDVNSVRQGYIACLEILGRIPTMQRDTNLTKEPKIGPTIKIRTGAGKLVEPGIRRMGAEEVSPSGETEK